MGASRILVASNRGPVSFVRGDDGEVRAKRGAGGLVTALTGAIAQAGGLWIASAMTEEDRERAGDGRFEVTVEDTHQALRYLAFDPGTYDRYYNEISNRMLWFVHHYLWDTVRSPQFDDSTAEAWGSYREVNRAFADALSEEGGDDRPDARDGEETAYLIQDYHLALVPALLRERRPEARITHFSHIPFAGPRYFSILPEPIRHELLTGLLGADVVGFQAEAWADAFLLTCRGLPGARVDLRRRRLRWRDREIRVRLYPIGIDAEALRAQAESEEVASARRRLSRWRGDASLILRVDRTELSKNILRGFLAYEYFLLRHPRWRRRVRFLALLNPSRRAVPEYRAYTRECLRTAERINDELGEDDWQPIEVSVKDDFVAAVAAYGQYDVLLVNPTYDGMNLVAKEGPAVNRRRGVLVLSQNAGAAAELGRHALTVNPFDLAETGEAIRSALEMPEDERSRRARSLRALVRRTRPEDWVRAQLEDLILPVAGR